MNRTTIRLRRLVLALLALAALYLVPANLFLNTPLGRWTVNRRPERLRVSWRSAWSLWPGRVDVRGLEIRGHQRSVRWRVATERGHGTIDLSGFFARRFRVDGFRGDGVRAWVVRDPPPPAGRTGARAARRPPPRRHGWTVELPGMVLTDVRDIEYGPAHIAGRGRVEGGFSLVVGGSFRLDRSSLVMRGARFDQAGKPLVRDVELRTAVEMGPYAPRHHPGMEGWDFLSGSLQAQGRVPDPPLLNRLGNAATREGHLTVDLRAEHGRLLPGSRMVLAPRIGRGEAPLRLSGSVASGPAGPVLFLTLQAAGLSLPAGPGQPPFLEVDALDLAGSSSEVRLRRIFSAAREIQTSRPLPDRLIGEVRARGVRLDVKGTRLACRMVLDEVQGKFDLPALLKRRLALADLHAQGGTVRVGLAPPSRAPSPTAGMGPPWAVDLAVARLAGLREVGFEPFVLVGDTTVDLSFLLEPDGPMSVAGASLTTKPGASLQAGGETVAKDVRIAARGRLAPLVLAEMPGAQALRFVSGDVDLKGRISSLGFLASWFRDTPWLDVQGSGDLALGLRVERGKLVSGTRVALRAARLEMRVLDSLASGVAAVNGSVETGREGPDGRLVVRFDRFGLQSLRLRGRPAYLRGRGLVLNVTSRSSVDLAAPIDDLRAVVDLPSAEVPDLRVFNPYLPPGAGIAVLSGRGRATLHWDLDGATRSGRGEARLLSEAARMRFQDLEIDGRFALHMPLVSHDLESRRFELGGTELSLAGISYRPAGGSGSGQEETMPADWWARVELAQGSLVWDEPLRLRGSGTVAMKNADPLVLLFAPRRQFLRWFQHALGVENIVARGSFVLAGDAFEVPALQAQGGPLELRARMRFSEGRRRADLLLDYGGLAAGIELRDGQRSFKLLGARQWYAGGKTAAQVE